MGFRQGDRNRLLRRGSEAIQDIKEGGFHLVVIIGGIFRQMRPSHSDINTALIDDPETVPDVVGRRTLLGGERTAIPIVREFLFLRFRALGDCFLFKLGFGTRVFQIVRIDRQVCGIVGSFIRCVLDLKGKDRPVRARLGGNHRPILGNRELNTTDD